MTVLRAGMTVLWAAIPDSDAADGEIALPQALLGWRLYHEACGMGHVSIAVHGLQAHLECDVCAWGEQIPFEASKACPGRHNTTALRRVAARRKCQELQLQTVMGGPEALPLAALLGSALRVMVCPLTTAEPGDSV